MDMLKNCMFTLVAVCFIVSCGSDDSTINIANTAPVVSLAIADVNVNEGFGTLEVDFSAVFTDGEGDQLTYTATSSDIAVVTVSVSNEVVTITEAGAGTSTITISANDGNGGSVNDSFLIAVNANSNNPPVVNAEIANFTLEEGFGSNNIEFSNTFTDSDNDALDYTVSSSNQGVATGSINGTILTITEVSFGMTTFQLTANDGNGGMVSDEFVLTVSESTSCTIDNSINTDLNQCPNTAADAGLTASYDETVNGDVRTIMTNNVPDHSFGSPIDKISEVDFTWKMDATPMEAGQITTLLGMSRIDFHFGVGLNGVKIDPEADFPYENTDSGEQNYGWMLEATNNTSTTTLDCNQGHLQANGAYHYHGDFTEYAEQEDINGTAMVQVGWAADGFPVYYKYAYSDASNTSSAIEEMLSSHQLKTGERPGDGVSEPCGEYNGKYEQDYEYVAGLGDLDECNGRTGVTPDFPGGTYYYLITGTYPYIPRCFSGTPDNSFRIGG